jgi:hypothetical protein
MREGLNRRHLSALVLVLSSLSGCGKEPSVHGPADAVPEKHAPATRAPADSNDVTASPTAGAARRGPRPDTSLIQLLANPDRFDKKSISTVGYLTVEFEDTAIYLSETEARYGMYCNGLWVSFSDNSLGLTTSEIAERYNGKYVRITGTFNRDENGHFSMWSGTIQQVSRLYELTDGDAKRRSEPGNRGTRY